MALVAGNVGFTGYQQPNYAGIAEAAALPMQALNQAVGQVGDYFKQQGEKKKLIKQSDVQIDAALKLFPDLAPALQGYRDQLKDENLPLDERTAIADSISNVINMGISEMRNARNMLVEQQKLGLEQQYKAAQLGMKAEELGLQRQKALMEAGELKETEISIFDPELGKERKEKVQIDKQGQYYDPETKRPIINKEKYFYGEEGGLGELPPTSQVGGSASDLIASAAQMNIGKLSTSKTPGTQGGNVGCADAICRTFKQATGEELVPGGTLSTRKMATTLENDPRFVKVPLDQAQKGDIVLTPRKGNKAGHTGIVLDGGAIASNSSKGFAGKAPGTFVQNYTIDSWKRNVAPRNPRETAAYRYVGSQGIDNALAMNGDITQQAMGTPQQQAEAARQIEQGQQLNLSTAQNTPQGAIPTEPSMVAQQPQLPQPQRRMVRGIPADGGKATPVMMTSEQVKNLEGQGFRVSAIPNPDGTFMVSGVTTGGSSSGFDVITPDGTRITYGGKGGLAQPKPEQGRQLIPDPTSPTGTRFVDIPGGEAEKAAKQEASAAEAEKEKAIQDGAVLIADIDRFIDYTGRMSRLPFASPVRKAFAAIGMEEQAEAENMLKSVKSVLKFKTIAELRKASPTGSTGLGQVTQNEFDATADAWGALSIVGNPDIQRERAIAVKTRMLDLIHGNQKHRDALLKSGAISQQQYNEIQSQYPGAKQVSQEDANIQRWRNTFTPQPTQ